MIVKINDDDNDNQKCIVDECIKPLNQKKMKKISELFKVILNRN